MTTPDPTMEAIGRAVAEGRAGDTEAARHTLLTLWPTLTDPLHRCTLAHHLADLYEDPAQALTWDIRALDAAADLTDRRLRDHHAGLRLAAFQPSLHLNLADDHRRLGSFDAAAGHIDAARAHVRELAEDAYGTMLRTAIEEVAEAISRRDTAKRGHAAGAGGAGRAGRHTA